MKYPCINFWAFLYFNIYLSTCYHHWNALLSWLLEVMLSQKFHKRSNLMRGFVTPPKTNMAPFITHFWVSSPSFSGAGYPRKTSSSVTRVFKGSETLHIHPNPSTRRSPSLSAAQCPLQTVNQPGMSFCPKVVEASLGVSAMVCS